MENTAPVPWKTPVSGKGQSPVLRVHGKVSCRAGTLSQVCKGSDGGQGGHLRQVGQRILGGSAHLLWPGLSVACCAVLSPRFSTVSCCSPAASPELPLCWAQAQPPRQTHQWKNPSSKSSTATTSMRPGRGTWRPCPGGVEGPTHGQHAPLRGDLGVWGLRSGGDEVGGWLWGWK